MPPVTPRWLEDWLSNTSGGLGGPLPVVRSWEGVRRDLADYGLGARDLLGADLRGKTVLHAGCGAGALCLEAARRGAGRVLGLDVDPSQVRLARAYARHVGLPAEFRVMDVERGLPEETFDIVVCTILHRARQPAALLDRLGSVTGHRLALEFVGPSSPGVAAYLEELGVPPRDLEHLNQLPVIVVGQERAGDPTGAAHHYLTPEAIRHLLMVQRRRFAHVDVTPLGSGGRFRAVADRRRIERLIVVAGPSRAGKTTLIENLRSGAGPAELRELLDVRSDERWDVAGAGDAAAAPTRDTPRLLFDYDLNRPWWFHAGRFERDEALDLLEGARRLTLVTVWADPGTLLQRGQARIARLSRTLRTLQEHPARVVASRFARSVRQALAAPRPHLTPHRLWSFVRSVPSRVAVGEQRAAAMRRLRIYRGNERLYRRAEDLMRRYLAWFEYCAGLPAGDHWVVDTTQEPWTIYAAERWSHLLLERTRARDSRQDAGLDPSS